MAKILGDYLDVFTENLLKTLNTPDAYLNKIALSTATLIIAFLINAVFKNLINKNVKNLGRNYKLQKVVKNSLITVVVVFILFIWIRAINALILIGLAAGALVIILLRGLIYNIIGYFVIKYYKHFKKGHRIEINGKIGDVIGMNPVNFQLLEVRNWLSSDTTTGRVIKMPNSIIFEHSVEMVGLDNEFIWQEIKYILSFDSNWKDAEKIMTDAANKHFHEFILPNLRGNDRLLFDNEEVLKPVFALTTGDYGIKLNIRYLVNYKNGTSTRTTLQREILSKFEENPNIKFAVSDVRIISK